jgi:HPr kinase/phosphorylase
MRVERGVSVAELLADPHLGGITRLVAGEKAQHRLLDHPRVQKPGLALVGHMHGVVPTRVQILGETEISFIEGLKPAQQSARVDALFSLGLSLVIVTRGVEPLPVLVEAAQATQTPLVVADPRSSRTIQAVHLALDELLAPSETRHGVLVDIHGIGALLLGPSGIGKSECALFLVERGHRLVADDQVVLRRKASGEVIGWAPPLLRNHLELRGIGIINVRDLFGANAVLPNKTVQLVIELCPWNEDETYDRLGLDDSSVDILGSPIPFLRIPVRSGRNMGVILEVAARNQMLKSAGRHGAQEFVRALENRQSEWER